MPEAAPIAASLTMPTLAGADERKDAAALTILETANTHYKAKRFDKAEQMYITAFEISRNPAYLFNAGRAAQRAFKLDRAEGHYKRYLSLEKADAKGIRRAKLHPQEVDEARAALKQAAGTRAPAAAPVVPQPTPAAPPPRVEPKPQPAPVAPEKASAVAPTPKVPVPPTVSKPAAAPAGWRTPAGWLAVGLGGAAAAWGTTLLVTSLLDRTDMDEMLAEKDEDGDITGLSYKTYADWETSVNDDIVQGHTFLWPGTAVLAAGVWLLLSRPDSTTVAWTPTRGGGSLHFSLRF